MALSYYAPALTITLDLARDAGVDSEPLLRAHRIDLEAVNNPRARLRLDHVLQFLQDLEERLPSRLAGLDAARFWTPNAMGVLGHAWLTSRTLRAAFHRLARFSRVVSEGVKVNLVETETSATLEFHFLHPGLAPWLRPDGTLAMLLAMCQALGGKSFRPQEVHVPHAQPRRTQPYRHLFGCPVLFRAEACRFQISAQAADAPRTAPPEQLEQLHDRLMLDYLRQMDEADLIGRVKGVIVDLLPSGNVTDARVARELHMTSRTLQRRLQERGTTFKRLLTEVRTDLAAQYLREGRHNLSEISFLLGFSELSAFSRAFKRWHGRPPSDYLRSA